MNIKNLWNVSTPSKFDILLSMNKFHAFPDKMKAFEETARVIKQGGYFIVNMV